MFRTNTLLPSSGFKDQVQFKSFNRDNGGSSFANYRYQPTTLDDVNTQNTHQHQPTTLHDVNTQNTHFHQPTILDDVNIQNTHYHQPTILDDVNTQNTHYHRNKHLNRPYSLQNYWNLSEVLLHRFSHYILETCGIFFFFPTKADFPFNAGSD